MNAKRFPNVLCFAPSKLDLSEAFENRCICFYFFYSGAYPFGTIKSVDIFREASGQLQVFLFVTALVSMIASPSKPNHGFVLLFTLGVQKCKVPDRSRSMSYSTGTIVLIGCTTVHISQM